MSYDLEIGTPERPSREEIVDWARSRGLSFDEDGWVGELFEVDGPVAALPEDFAEEIAAACPTARWMLSVLVPYSVGDRAIELACDLAETLAKAHAGAGFDPQTDELIWPLGTTPTSPPRGKERRTSVVTLEWLVTAEHWERAPARLLEALRRHFPESLPGRYGRWEPPQHHYDADAPDAFARFVLDEDEGGDGFWFASPPSFGGSWFVAHEHGIAQLEVDVDQCALDEDARRREALVELFVGAARELRAFFAAAQVEPGWTVNAHNRLYATAKTAGRETLLTIDGWRGLPPVPTWLSWFGGPYRELVEPHLVPERFLGPRKGLLRRRTTPEVHIDTDPDGILVRIGEAPKPAGEMGNWPLPPELTYQYRPPYTRNRDGSITSNPPQRGDEAATIPRLRPRT